jgi:hypothetical protein
VNYYSGAWTATETTPPLLDVFLMDEDNLLLARNDEPFTAAFARTGVSELDESIYPPTDATWHLLVKNFSSSWSDHVLDVSVATEGEPWQPGDDDTVDDDGSDDDTIASSDDDDDNGSSGCGC